MNYSELVGKVWKTKITVSNGNTDYGEISLAQITRFARAERKKAADEDKTSPKSMTLSKSMTLAPAAKWVVGLALKGFEEYVELLDDKDVGLVSIEIQCV